MTRKKTPRRRKPPNVQALGNTREVPGRSVRWPMVAAAVCVCVLIVGFFVATSSWRNDDNWLDSISLPDNGAGQPRASDELENDSPGSPSPQPARIRALIDEATGVAERLVERFPDDVASLGLLAQVSHRSGNVPPAIELWKRCLERDPAFIDAHMGIASVLIERGEYGQAEIVLRKALSVDPGSTQALILLANALMNQGKMTETATLLERDIESAPPVMPRLLLLGQAYLQLKQYENAKQAFIIAARLAPEFPNAHYGLATACARLGQKHESAQHTERFRELEAQDRQQQLAQARRSDDALSQSKDVAETYLAAGRIYAAAGDASQAEAHWRKAADHDPDNVLCREEILRLCQQQGRTQDAREILERLQEIQQRR